MLTFYHITYQDLRNLWLFENDLTGTLPSEIGQLTKLTKLTFGGNRIEGPLPSELGKLTNLQDFLMAANTFTGSTIPEEFWKMTNLLVCFIMNKETGHFLKGTFCFVPLSNIIAVSCCCIIVT